jgi:DNA-directed RNA polymerase specialized sigma24 family protein
VDTVRQHGQERTEQDLVRAIREAEKRGDDTEVDRLQTELQRLARAKVRSSADADRRISGT